MSHQLNFPKTVCNALYLVMHLGNLLAFYLKTKTKNTEINTAALQNEIFPNSNPVDLLLVQNHFPKNTMNTSEYI